MVFAIIGDDARQIKLAQMLRCTERVQDADVVVLPILLMKQSFPVESVIASMTTSQILAGGFIPDEIIKAAQAKGIRVIDYGKRDELAIKNAVPTAEAALQIAMQHLSITIHGCRALVIGYGRIGKTLSKMLYSLGAHTSVSARKSTDMAWIKNNGFFALHTTGLDPHLNNFDVIFNTVPHLIVDETAVKKTRNNCLLIDLASAPGGIDIEAAKRHGRTCEWALALPGKHSPDTAAENLRQTLFDAIKEEME